MNIWTTFTPGKVTWELTKVQSKGKGATSDWQKNLPIIKTSLQKLKTTGIVGIRLVIYPSEITKDGRIINWKPIDTMLNLCKENKLAVDFCIGPFQYPHYPGIFLPEQLKQYIPQENYLDSDKTLAIYGMDFLQKQLTRYGNDSRIHGFHFANEWPDFQRISGKETIRIGVSEAFMLHAATFLKQKTKKPILMNTNIDAGDKRKIWNTFDKLLSILGKQAKLGFDIYPSQETWMKSPLQKLRRLFEPYPKSLAWSCKRFNDCEIYFTEVESQPWGNGQSWYQMISNEENPNETIFGFHKNDLQKTWNKHITETSCQTVNLWGSDFWLSADAMKISWPLEMVRKLTSGRTDK